MKIFAFNGYFLLPDDFSGGYNEALEELVEYRLKQGFIGTQIGEEFSPKITQQTELWDKFLEVISSDKKVVAGYGLYSLNQETNLLDEIIYENKTT